MKKQIDIEKLLQWAMREELPKGQRVAASPWDMITQFAALGVRVQTSGYCGDGFGFTPGAPHEDAITVAAAMKGIDTKATFKHLADAAPLFTGLVLDGELIDARAIAGDAMRSIMLASFDPRSIVISNATMGTRPKWKFEHPTPHQMFSQERNARGELRAIALVHGVDSDGYEIAIKKNRGRKAMREAFDLSMTPRSPINWHDPSLLHIGECRAEYVAWHHALTRLALDLAGKLKEFEPMAPVAAALPWITGETPTSRIVARRDFGNIDIAGKLVEPKIQAKTRAA